MLEAAILCLSWNIYNEGLKKDGRFTEPLIGLAAIAQVTLTRAKRKPENVCDVVRAHRQFSWTIPPGPPPPEENEAWRQAQDMARLAFHTSDFTGGATHFWAYYSKPYWKPDMEILGQYGNHIFGKQKARR